MGIKTEEIFIDQSIRYMRMSINRIRRCLDQLSEDDLWFSANQHTNSIGNLVIHLAGNIDQYINSGLGNAIDNRNRDSEFIPNQKYLKNEVYNKLENAFDNAMLVIQQVGSEKLKREYELQGFKMTGMEAILHVTEHLSYHTGQIALVTKILKKKDLGFYSGKNLNKKNK